MNKKFIQIGAIIGFLSVGLGAFGAHALKNHLTEINKLEVYETAIRYMFFHAIALILIGIIAKDFNNKWILRSGNFMFYGILVFSGSLIILCLSNVTILGAITPIGGVLMLLGWLSLFKGVSE